MVNCNSTLYLQSNNNSLSLRTLNRPAFSLIGRGWNLPTWDRNLPTSRKQTRILSVWGALAGLDSLHLRKLDNSLCEPRLCLRPLKMGRPFKAVLKGVWQDVWSSEWRQPLFSSTASETRGQIFKDKSWGTEAWGQELRDRSWGQEKNEISWIKLNSPLQCQDIDGWSQSMGGHKTKFKGTSSYVK